MASGDTFRRELRSVSSKELPWIRCNTVVRLCRGYLEDAMLVLIYPVRVTD